MDLEVVSEGTVTDTEALPELHDSVWGSPEIAGVTDNTQLLAPVTEAESSTGPPVWGSELGEAVKEEILGGEALGLAAAVDLGTGGRAARCLVAFG